MAFSDNRPLHKRHHKATHPLWKTEMEISVVVGLVILAVAAVWIFNTILPPPSVFAQGSLSVYGQNDTIMAVAPQGHSTDTLVLSITAPSGEKFQVPSPFSTSLLPAGTYTVYAYDSKDGRYSNPETVIITKGSPELTLNSISSHDFNNISDGISFSINSTTGQLVGTLYLNGTAVANTTGNGEYNAIVSPGAYNVTFKSEATQNYSAISKSFLFAIYPNIIFNRSQNLTSDVNVKGNITIGSNVTLTLNGHSVIAGGTFANYGIIKSGFSNSRGQPQKSVNPYVGTISNDTNATDGESFTSSYGGGGGTGSGCASYGGSTIASGGSYIVSGITCTFVNATVPPTPAISQSIIASWYGSGMYEYTSGAGGGGGEGSQFASGGYGGNGAYGVYIQADRLIAGTINASGQNGLNGISGIVGSGGGGGGGGAVVLLAYGPGGYVKGNYTVNQGIGGTGGINDQFYGGNGIAGQVLTYNYPSSPILICDAVCLGSNDYH